MIVTNQFAKCPLAERVGQLVEISYLLQKMNTLVWFILNLALVIHVNANVFFGQVTSPSSPFAISLAGSTALDNFYNTFNVTILLAIGAGLIAVGGLAALPLLPKPYELKYAFDSFVGSHFHYGKWKRKDEYPDYLEPLPPLRRVDEKDDEDEEEYLEFVSIPAIAKERPSQRQKVFVYGQSNDQSVPMPSSSEHYPMKEITFSYDKGYDVGTNDISDSNSSRRLNYFTQGRHRKRPSLHLSEAPGPPKMNYKSPKKTVVIKVDNNMSRSAMVESLKDALKSDDHDDSVSSSYRNRKLAQSIPYLRGDSNSIRGHVFRTKSYEQHPNYYY